MKDISAKKQERLEKKKKKLAALAEIIKLNDNDRDLRNRSSSVGSRASNSNSDNDLKSDKRRDKTPKRNEMADSNSIEIEPKKKKVKTGDLNEDTEKSEDKANISENCLPAIQSDGQITDEEYLMIKKKLNKRKHAPTFRLKEYGELASLSVDYERRTPIFLTDIQHLLMGASIGAETGSIPTRWCSVEKLGKLSHSVVLIVEGISLFHYLSYENNFEKSNEIFDNKLEVIFPSYEEGQILRELATVPLTAAQKDELIEKYGSLETAIEMNKDPTLMVKEVFNIEKNDTCKDNENAQKKSVEETDDKSVEVNCENEDKFPRTKLLLSALQMVEEGYPLPLRGELASKYANYKFTKDVYLKVTSKSPLFGVDCEMCKTTVGLNELTRISIVNEELKSVYETLVRPNNRIIDYLTPFSGITPEMMLTVTKQLEEVQNDVIKLLPADAILVGQSLHSDLHALRMMHPYVIDTSVIFNLSGERRRKSKLQFLAKEFLGESIQQKIDGHDSIEDSLASIKLTKLKLSNGIDFGDIILTRKKEQNEAKKNRVNLSNNFFACVSKVEKTAAIISTEDIPEELKIELEGNYKINTDDKESHSLQNKIQYYRTNGNTSAIKKTTDVIYDNFLTICNINLSQEQLELPKIEKTIENIDKWIHKIHESVSSNGLFIVLIGGSPEAKSGVAMIKIKKQAIDSSTAS